MGPSPRGQGVDHGASRAKRSPARCGNARRSRPAAAVAWQRMTGVDASGRPALEPLLCIEEVAQLLRISERGVYRLMHRGELASLKVGHRTLVEPQEVRQFIDGQRRLTASARR